MQYLTYDFQSTEQTTLLIDRLKIYPDIYLIYYNKVYTPEKGFSTSNKGNLSSNKGNLSSNKGKV